MGQVKKQIQQRAEERRKFEEQSLQLAQLSAALSSQSQEVLNTSQQIRERMNRLLHMARSFARELE